MLDLANVPAYTTSMGIVDKRLFVPLYYFILCSLLLLLTCINLIHVDVIKILFTVSHTGFTFS